ncbi:MAG: NAD(P)-dependent oxidoreductase [Yoonia sp.]|nr:NAD(P)-dependent oxidoreductase [Yoonia sp.]MDG1862660.1 NAD(P)-dependent oxidoreductase [Yoonia sp.]
MHKIGFFGIGLMGLPMARHLVAAGHDITVWNRNPAKAEAVSSARAALTPADAVRGASIIISILSDGAATAAVQSDPALREALSRDQIWIEMASVKPDEARAQSADLAAFGVAHLDAPVSGGTAGAEAATLAIMVGGDLETFNKAAPVLRHLGTPTRVGPSGAGQLAKLANQGIVGITIGAVAEAMLLVQRGGADPAAVREALKGGFADSKILQLHGARMTDDDLGPRGRAATQLKDMNNIMEEAEKLSLSLPMSADIQARFATLCNEMGGADLDHAALYLELLRRNQLS